MCPAGSFCADASQVAQCPAGSFCPEGSTAPTPCSLGGFCAAGSSYDRGCDAGTYCPDALSVVDCPAGSFCAANVSEPTACTSGSSCPAGTSEEVDCPAGFYCTKPSAPTEKCSPGSYCPARSTAEEKCPVGSYCATPVTVEVCPPGFWCAEGVNYLTTCSDGSFCPEGSGADTPCLLGFCCPDTTRQLPCSAGTHCPPGSMGEDLCPAGSACPDPSTRVECEPGFYCPEGSTIETTACSRGYYCETASTQTACPAGYYCREGSSQAAPCQHAVNCPPGSTIDPSKPMPLSFGLTLPGATLADMTASGLVLQAALKSGVTAWVTDVQDPFGDPLAVDDVFLTCLCESGSCAANVGVTLSRMPCGTNGTGIPTTRRAAQEASLGVDVEVVVGSNEARVALEDRWESIAFSLRDALVASGALDASLYMDPPVVYAGLAPEAADVGNVGALAAQAAEDYSQILVSVMVAVPLAMLVVAVAVYQNRKKEKPVKLPGLIVFILFAWYDLLSDVWFAVMPMEPEYKGFSIACAVVIAFSTLIGLAVVVLVLRRHSLREFDFVSTVLIIMATTNLDLLPLLPWADDSKDGVPDHKMNSLPTITILAEDLPQLLIQGSYLITSGDTGNVLVLVSVSISGCSLLLRFARGAMSMVSSRAQRSPYELVEEVISRTETSKVVVLDTESAGDLLRENSTLSKSHAGAADALRALADAPGLDGENVVALSNHLVELVLSQVSDDDSDDEGDADGGFFSSIQKNVCF